MYILTTSKRIHQLTVWAFICLTLMSALSIWSYYTAYVHQPQQFADKLQQAAMEKLELQETDVRIDVFVAHEALRVLAAIEAELELAGIENAHAAAELLLQSSTAYLRDDVKLVAWLNQMLPRWYASSSEWQVEKQSLRHWQIRSGEHCLKFERRGRWQLTEISAC